VRDNRDIRVEVGSLFRSSEEVGRVVAGLSQGRPVYVSQVARGGLTGVFVVSGNRAFLRWVALGASVGSATEVRAGVEAGEHVVIEPMGLVDGARVEVVR
jgi:hypothetical protein